LGFVVGGSLSLLVVLLVSLLVVLLVVPHVFLWMDDLSQALAYAEVACG
jgi:hypothetical protein